MEPATALWPIDLGMLGVGLLLGSLGCYWFIRGSRRPPDDPGRGWDFYTGPLTLLGGAGIAGWAVLGLWGWVAGWIIATGFMLLHAFKHRGPLTRPPVDEDKAA